MGVNPLVRTVQAVHDTLRGVVCATAEDCSCSESQLVSTRSITRKRRLDAAVDCREHQWQNDDIKEDDDRRMRRVVFSTYV